MNTMTKNENRICWLWVVLLCIPFGSLQTWLLTQPISNPFAVPDAGPAPTFDSTAFYAMAFVMLIAGVPFGLFLPGLKVSFLGRSSRMPKESYVFSQKILKLICSIYFGAAIGGLLVLPLIPIYAWPFVVSVALATLAMGFATRRRFRRSEASQWVAPNPWYKIFRPIIRGTRPD